ncbi:hypothetical protein UA08_05297 [Talaromyces atroroseus]|uniref:Uncharacterized protein n=1 Tax=Talaromyces atroroseus TaxID=1441469 RepID=A0A225AQA6_TALAT|nr:hypothetical protein UA08_05297 [Talaromyces atroroseus]OKL59438.1 hypothetical protein UA08_05297 [Talaromyces atroroseus]
MADHRKQHQVGPCLKWLETKFNITDSDDCHDYYHSVRQRSKNKFFTMRMTSKFYADKRKASSQLSISTTRERSDEGGGGGGDGKYGEIITLPS